MMLEKVTIIKQETEEILKMKHFYIFLNNVLNKYKTNNSNKPVEKDSENLKLIGSIIYNLCHEDKDMKETYIKSITDESYSIIKILISLLPMNNTTFQVYLNLNIEY